MLPSSQTMTFEEFAQDHWGDISDLTESQKKLARQQYDDYYSKTHKAQKGFKSSHFDEPNILVHLRMNTRTDAGGNKVLFLEEIQSDWGQKGRNEGFKKTINERKKEILETKGVKIQDNGGSYYGVMFGDQLLTSIPKESWDDGVSGTIADVERVLNKYNPNQDTPSAPFITDTNAWTKLGLKVALKEAVAQGAERIAWTTGEQQNDRYDLSKQVDRIDVERVEGQKDLFFVDITMPNGEVNYLEVENGRVRNDESVYQGQRLEDLVGKEVAEKILKGGTQTLQGEGLKVGGKGMKGFYGEPSEGKEGIVGSVAKALVKELTGAPIVKIGRASCRERVSSPV